MGGPIYNATHAGHVTTRGKRGKYTSRDREVGLTREGGGRHKSRGVIFFTGVFCVFLVLA
jgi:hypothetical protein